MRRALLLFAVLVLIWPVSSLAQTGFPPFGSFQAGGFDAVNRQNLNANFAIPIVSTPGRGVGFGFAIVYDTLIWTNGGSGTNWYVVTDPSGVGTWGWKTKWPIGAIYYTHTTTLKWVNCGTSSDPYFVQQQTDKWYNYSYTDQAGTSHPFPVSYTDAQTCSGSDTITGTTTGNATDATGFFINIGDPSFNAPVVYTRSGTQITSTTLKDTNGNFISQNVISSSEMDWTDSANHTALRIVTVGSNVEYHYLDTTGTDQKYTLKYQNYSIKTAFGCTGITDYNLNGTMPQVSLPYELDLPNGQKYSFAYEPTPGSTGFYTGRLTQVTLPTGGTVQYTYPTTPNNGVSCTDGSVLTLTRTASDGTNSNSWTYARSGSTTTITAPAMPYDSAANNSVYNFNSGGQQTSALYYQGAVISQNLKSTVNLMWATNGTPATRVTTLVDGNTQNEAETSYDSNGNLLSLKEHDWGANAPGAVLRTTTWTYLNGTAYTAANILNRVTNVTVTDNTTNVVHSRTDIAYDDPGYINYGACHTAVPQHDDTAYSCTSTVRGNPTTVTTYTNAATPSGSIAHHKFYDNLGNLVQADLDCCQQETWVYSTATNYSFPDSSTRGTGTTQLTSSATHNAYTGLVATSTDENGQVTNYSYDLLKRLTNVQRPGNANLTWTYTDALPPSQSSVTASVPIQGTSVQKTTTAVDGLGRAVTQQVSDGTTTYSIVATQYDPAGRAYKVSNPYTSVAQYWTTTQFDAIGRPTVTILPDNSQTTFSYVTITTTITDPAGKQRKSQFDGLGRVTSVYEPDPSNGNSLTLQTSYAYNILDRLTGVTQGSQTRAYGYDDLGRVTSVQTPETNQVAAQFQYNNFGLVTQRTDPRGVITSYGYDTLNRLTSVSYNVGTTGVPATSSVSFTYGTSQTQLNNGRLITMTDGVGSESYSYNNLGQLTQLQKVIGATTYTMGYQYNLAGELSSVTYPSGRVVQQSFDAIGRLSSIVGTLNTSNTTYASGFGYNPAQQTTGIQYGNNLFASFGFSPDRLQLNCLDYSTTNRNGACSHDATTKFGLTYSYGATGSNNGLISGITDSVDSGRSATYTYDALYRLSSAATTGSANYPAWGLSETYDRYGNRLNQTATAGAPPTNSLSFANPGGAQTNRPDGMCFDANGNLTAESGTCPPVAPTYSYDAENRLVSYMGTGGTYTFDGNGLRVKKVSGTTTTVYLFSGSKVIAEYDNGAAPASPSREYIYSGATLLAKIEAGATMYYHPDHLSNRLLTDAFGNTLGQRGHYPFGETWYETGSTTKIKFTSYERDSESGNDYAMARYYVNRFGRFPSTDPLPGSTSDPQSLNRYTYSRNVPVSLFDPTGMVTDCTILQRQDNDKEKQQQVAVGNAGPNADDASSDSSETPEAAQQGWGCGSSTPGGYPIGGGNIFDLLWATTWTFPDGEHQMYVVADLSSLFGLLGFGPGGGPDLSWNDKLLGKQKQPEPPPGYEKCKQALSQAGADFNGLQRALDYWATLQAVGFAEGLDPRILGAIGLRESDFIPSRIGDYGHGHGTFQIDDRWHPREAATIAYDVDLSASFSAGLVMSGYRKYSERGYAPGTALAAGIREFNGTGGIPTARLLANGSSLDIGTTGGNYVSNVLAMALNCF